MSHKFRSVWLAFALLSSALANAQELVVKEQLTVGRVILDVRVIDTKGVPIADLTAEDFVLKDRGKEIPILSCEWVAAPNASPTEPETAQVFDIEEPRPEGGDWTAEEYDDPFWQDDPAGAENRLASGRLIVIYVQMDLAGDRNYGILRMLKETEGIVAGLEASDYVAVVSFHAHFKLHLDFTRDHFLVREALNQALTKADGVKPKAGPFPSLARYLDPDELLTSTQPEHGLLIIGQSMLAFGGPKTLLFLAWGLGERDPTGVVHMRPDYYNARRVLTESRTAVFALDTSIADFHDLEIGLEQVAEDTGGFYAKTHRFAGQAVNKFLNAIEGHYVLTFELPQPQPERPNLSLELRDLKGEILVPSPYNRRRP